jgi:hypothetical protein
MKCSKFEIGDLVRVEDFINKRETLGIIIEKCWKTKYFYNVKCFYINFTKLWFLENELSKV